MSREENRNQKMALVEQWQQSGLTQREFARVHGIKESLLHYWIGKARRENHGQDTFIQIGTSASTHISLRYPNGVELTLPVHTPVEMVKQLIDL
ncbi:MAG: transposase [Bacteroidales bacterium]|nr:transposase [Bacteroidales bacterium]